ncbi:MAG: carbonic anhydrase [Methyloprofundus sp.]|nr:carbonic anhydrase [Methyloprofundus sp.]
MQSCEILLQKNKQWAKQKLEQDPDFFNRLATTQSPEFLWIGCSDSRVSPEILVGAEPGEIFMHRNIANQVIHTDFNCLSVLQYAVSVLKVKHIIVCGHYNCGGIKAALDKQRSDLLITNKWLMHIKNTYRLHQEEIDSFEKEEDRHNRLVELNVIEQIRSLSHTSIIQTSWAKNDGPVLHGWVYGVNDGQLRSLTTRQSTDEIHPIFQYRQVSAE